MKQPRSFVYHILMFVIAQFAWLSLLGLWIYWYVTNYIFMAQVGDQLSPQFVPDGRNLLALIGGVVLLITLSVFMSILFHRLNLWFNLTRLYDNFIANVTHELKSPLASIQLYLETMRIRELTPEKQQEFIQLMLKDTSRLNTLINAILEIPALEQKKIAHNFHIYDMKPLIERIASDAVEQFQLPADALEYAGNSSCKCVVDQEAIKIVLNNLIDNSIKYSIGPVHIRIQWMCSSKQMIITYSDTGIGISEKDKSKVFQKFIRINRNNIPSVKGTGLGLYWAREIIKYHGGKIYVKNIPHKTGATFCIELPIYREKGNRYIDQLLKLTQRHHQQED